MSLLLLCLAFVFSSSSSSSSSPFPKLGPYSSSSPLSLPEFRELLGSSFLRLDREDLRLLPRDLDLDEVRLEVLRREDRLEERLDGPSVVFSEAGFFFFLRFTLTEREEERKEQGEERKEEEQGEERKEEEQEAERNEEEQEAARTEGEYK